MFKMLNQLWSMLETLFRAAERGAQTLDNLAMVGEEKSLHFLNEERAKNAKKLIELEADLTKAIAP